MKKVGRGAADFVEMQQLYYHTRFPAMALAFALTLDKDEAFALSKKAHTKEGGLPSNRISNVSLLRRVIKGAPAKNTSRDKETKELTEKFSQLARPSLCAWVLTSVCSLSPGEAGQVVGLTGESLEKHLKSAMTKMTSQDARQLHDITAGLLSKKELWAEIVYDMERRRNAGRLAWRAFLAVVAAALLVFVSREAVVFTRILSLRPAESPAVAAERYDSPVFFRHLAEEPNPGQPRINQALLDSMSSMDDGQLMRVSFRFYDRETMRSTGHQGKTLEELYTDIYNSSSDRGRVNTLAANAINLYYADYVRPFQAKHRTSDFVSTHDSVYSAALHISRGSGFAQTVEAHPEIFASRSSFENYLLSDAFLGEAPYLRDLLRIEFAMGVAGAETPLQRQQYEDEIFVFTNPAGINGKVIVAGFSFQQDELRAFYKLRESLGRALYQSNLERCLGVLPAQAQVSSDILEGSDSSLFSATLSKEQVLRIAQKDERFFFLGLAPWADLQPQGRIETELALRSHENLLGRHDVYMIDDQFLLYSVNYAAPLRLPAGFIKDIRDKLKCEDTLFENELQYHYQMRYAHPQTRTGYGILRALEINQGIRFTTQLFKNFSKMAAY